MVVSDIFEFSPLKLWWKIFTQFDESIFFRWVGNQPSTRTWIIHPDNEMFLQFTTWRIPIAAATAANSCCDCGYTPRNKKVSQSMFKACRDFSGIHSRVWSSRHGTYRFITHLFFMIRFYLNLHDEMWKSRYTLED